MHVVVDSGVAGGGDGRPPKPCATCRAPLPDRHATWCRGCTAVREREQSRRSSASHVQRLKDEIARLEALLSPSEVIRRSDGAVVVPADVADRLHDLAQNIVQAVEFVRDFTSRVEGGEQPAQERWLQALGDEKEVRRRARLLASELSGVIGFPDPG